MLDRLAHALRLKTSPLIFFGSFAIVTTFVLYTTFFTENAKAVFAAGATWIIDSLGWFYILGVTAFLLFLIFLMAGRFGRVRLGRDDEKPQHSDRTWFAMLFAGGTGTILMFWGVAEPVNHYANPPFPGVEPESLEAASNAMAITLYHFGLHTWVIFCLPGLAFAYFMYKRNLPPRVSSLFQPLLGERIHGNAGRIIDMIAIIGTIFGVGVSIGLGTMQINAGLARLFGMDESTLNRLLIIAGITIISAVSAMLGLEKGVKRLSNMNMTVAIGFLGFVLLTGPTMKMIKGIVESIGAYAAALPWLSFWTDAFQDSGWQASWTVFYWAWTITWSPFVGIFIAQISRGRTVREFVGGVLALPVAFSVLWFGAFAMGAFDIERRDPGALVTPTVVENDIPGALFAFLEHFPLTQIVSVIAIVLVAMFFVTSLDSAGLVMDQMSAGHGDETSAYQRALWVGAVGAVGSVLIAATGAGGLEALQNVAIIVGLPFFVIGFLMMYSMWRALREDAGEVGVVTTRIWRRVLPPEEYQRRASVGALADEVVAPDYVEGTAPENAPDLEHPEQPEYVEADAVIGREAYEEAEAAREAAAQAKAEAELAKEEADVALADAEDALADAENARRAAERALGGD